MKMLGHDVANEHEVYTDEEIKLLIDESTESGLIDPSRTNTWTTSSTWATKTPRPS